jgi:hypothetical protein
VPGRDDSGDPAGRIRTVPHDVHARIGGGQPDIDRQLRFAVE